MNVILLLQVQAWLRVWIHVKYKKTTVFSISLLWKYTLKMTNVAATVWRQSYDHICPAHHLWSSSWLGQSIGDLSGKCICYRPPDQWLASRNACPLLFIVFCKTVDNVSSTLKKYIYFCSKKQWLLGENRSNLVAFSSLSGWKCTTLICMQHLEFKECLRKLNEGWREHKSSSQIRYTKEKSSRNQ